MNNTNKPKLEALRDSLKTKRYIAAIEFTNALDVDKAGLYFSHEKIKHAFESGWDARQSLIEGASKSELREFWLSHAYEDALLVCHSKQEAIGMAWMCDEALVTHVREVDPNGYTEVESLKDDIIVFKRIIKSRDEKIEASETELAKLRMQLSESNRKNELYLKTINDERAAKIEAWAEADLLKHKLRAADSELVKLDPLETKLSAALGLLDRISSTLSGAVLAVPGYSQVHKELYALINDIASFKSSKGVGIG